MKISDVQVEGFGVWSGLTLGNLSHHCTVFYGPNEAGKTTLLQFLRAVLYGFSPDRRAQYLPPVRGGLAGGALSVHDADGGTLSIARREQSDRPLGATTVAAPDGTVHGDAQLQRLLHDVVEATFNNIFAVGLRELQELGTLTDTDAARWLYSLSAGVDRVSLFDVQHELQRSRQRLLASDDRPSQISDLLAQRDRLRRELETLADLSQRHAQLASDRAACDQEIAWVTELLAKHEAEHSGLKAAAAAYDAWQRRGKFNWQLDAISKRDPWPADAGLQMKRITWGIKTSRMRAARCAKRRSMLGRELRQITFNEPLWRQAARIEALAEHESWIVSAEQQLRAAETATKALGDQQQQEYARAQTALPQIAGLVAQFDEQKWLALQGPAAAVSKARRRYKARHRRITEQQTAAQNRRRELDAALGPRGQRNLTAAIETAGQQVSQLRRRSQLDERIEQLAATQTELQERSSDLAQRQILSPTIMIALGGVFVLGVVLLLAGLLLPASFTGSWGWPLTFFGLVGAGGAVAAKFALEKTAELQLDSCQKQLSLTQRQTTETTAERDALDRTLPKGAGSWMLRLQAAEQELARLEELLPLEAQRQTAEQSAQELDQQGVEVKQKYQQAMRRWREALLAVGLPETLTPKQVRTLSSTGGQASLMARRLAEAQSDAERHRRELAALAGRIEQTFLAAGLQAPSTIASEQLRYLRRELAEQEGHRERQTLLRQRRQKLRRRQLAAEQQLRRWRRRRQRLFAKCKVADLKEFRRCADDFAHLSSLVAQRDAAALEVAAQLAGAISEQGAAELLADKTAEQLASKLEAAARQLEETRQCQQRLFQQRGQLNEQIRLVGGDRRLAVKRFELAQLEQRLLQAVQRWQVLTVTGKLLEWIKLDYEKNRQPETLRQASEYLSRLTDGHYRRVWTPFGENILLVDDHEGRSLGIDVLSRGTREQLFLSLRLALVDLFARRGAVLPMILDDVLVNFDTRRAIAAAQVLRDFAAAGHQLLVFTCHEHIAQLFQSLQVDVRQLPSNLHDGHDLPYSNGQHLPPRRARTRRIKEEAPMVEVVVEPVVEPTVEHTLEEPQTVLAQTVVDTTDQQPTEEYAVVRIDQPEPVVRAAPMHRRIISEFID